MSMTAGPAAANKVVAPTSIAGGVQVLVFDLSPTPSSIPSGVVANVTLLIAAGTPAASYPISISNVFSSGMNGAVQTTATGGMVAVGSPGPTTVTLSGSVTSNTGPVANVRVDGGPIGVQFTNGSGNYNFGSLPQGTNYTLTPTLSGYQFNPSSTPVAALNSNTVVNFTATPTSTTTTSDISGRVTFNNAGLAGATVNLTLNGQGGNNRITDGNGNYSFTSVQNGQSYSVTPVLSGYNFNPGSRSGVLNGNVSGADFSAFTNQAQTYTISGTVLLRGAPMGGVRINGGILGDRDTGSNGQYSFTNVTAGTPYTLTPSRTGYIFTPSQRTGIASSNVTAGFTASNCTGTRCPAVTYTAAGRVTYNGQGLPGASVRMGRTYGTTSADGSFNLTGIPRGTYYTRPVLTGMVFSPVNRRVAVTDQNVTGLDFTAKCFSTFKVLMNGKCDYPRYNVSGRVLMNGVPVPGVTVRVSTGKITTDANGAYTLPNIRAGLYYPSVSLGGYNFTSSLNTRILRLTQNTTVDFAAVCRAGYVVVDGKCGRAPRVRVTAASKK